MREICSLSLRNQILIPRAPRPELSHYTGTKTDLNACTYSKASLFRLQSIRIEIWKMLFKLSTHIKRLFKNQKLLENYEHVRTVRGDLIKELQQMSVRIKLDSPFNLYYYIQRQEQLPSLLSMNKYIVACFGYITRLITSLCQECSDYLLSFASTITLCNYTTSTIFSGGHPKTVLRMQSPLWPLLLNWPFVITVGIS
jgi:hypothetical protein